MTLMQATRPDIVITYGPAIKIATTVLIIFAIISGIWFFYKAEKNRKGERSDSD